MHVSTGISNNISDDIGGIKSDLKTTNSSYIGASME
jgi:hypothetical protein